MRQQRTEPAAIGAEIAHLRSLALDALRRRGLLECPGGVAKQQSCGLSRPLLMTIRESSLYVASAKESETVRVARFLTECRAAISTTVLVETRLHFFAP
jgi:hypothetical protein